MKYIKQTLLLLLAITTIIACSEDDPFTGISVTAPSNLQMNIQPDADQVGLVNIIPTAEGASYFKLDFGDGSTEDRIDLGQVATHQYAEGTFTITGTAFNVMEDSIQATQTLTVAFDPPSDLILNISVDEVNTNVITVTPSATNAMSYDIFFGDIVDEVPTVIVEGSSANHSYTEAGDFEVRVIARSGSITTIEATETVSITLPAVQLGFPIDFESDEIDYGLISFGNADLSIIDNPDMNGNASNKVVKFFKANGAEVWAGGLVELPNPIDLSNENNITMDVWSPKSGATVMIKIENSSDPNIFVEVMATTTTSNAWENLTFDFSSADQASDYSKVVVFMDFGIPGDDSDDYFDNIKVIRNTPETILESYRNYLLQSMRDKSVEERQQWSMNQAYIALGNLMTVCAIEGIDSCPMEGFNPEKYDEILNLKDKGLKSLLLLPVGYRAEDDMFATFKKVRKDINKTIIELN